MFGLNQPAQIPSVITGAYANPVEEFRARVEAMTPQVFITGILLAVNVIVYLMMIMSGVDPMQPKIDSLIQWGANFGPRTITTAEWWRLFTSMFLHIGIIHLAFNMLVLWQIGPFVERLLGNTGFLIVYVVSGIAGALVSVADHPYVVSAGASGAIFGLYRALLGFLVTRHDSIPVEVLFPLTKSTALFVAYNLIYGVLHTGTDLADHIGGLAAGAICGLCMSIPLTAQNPPERSIRNVAVAVAAVALIIGAAVALPRPADLQAVLREFGVMEKRTVATYNSGLAKVRVSQLRGEQLANLLDKEIIPDWVSEQKKLTALKGLPERQRRAISLLLQYTEDRREAWSLLAEGFRKHDINKLSQANSKQREAQQAVKQITSLIH
jgi:rhomboid protease GluP